MRITRGSNTTLKAETLETRLLEAFQLLTSQSYTVEEISINWDVDIAALQATISYRLPATHIVDTDGSTKIWGLDIINDENFMPGDGGQFKSGNLNSQIVEMLYFGQSVEIAQSTQESRNRITVTYNSDEQNISGNLILSIEVERNDRNGYLSIAAKEFLN